MTLFLLLALPFTGTAVLFFFRAVNEPYRNVDKAFAYFITLLCGIAASAFWVGFILVRFGEWPWLKRDSPPDTRHPWERDLPYR